MNLKTEIKAALQLALPMAAGQLAQFSLHLIDTLMCGQLGGRALAGAGLGTSFSAMLWLPAAGIVSAVAPVCAHGYGAGHPQLIRSAVQQALLLTVIIFLPVFLLFSYSRPILLGLGQSPDLIPLAEAFLHAARWGVLPALGITVLRGLMESLGKPRPGLLISITGIFINIAANWLLIFGNLGFPALGVAGTGWATTCVNFWMFACLMIWCLRDPHFKAYFNGRQNWRLDAEVLKELLKIGLPMGGGILAEVWLFTGMAFLMGHFGAHALAAHQITLNIASASFMVALGIANASTIRVGQALGRKEPLAAQQAGVTGMLLGMGFMGCVGVFLWLFPYFFIGRYLNLHSPDNQPVIQIAVSLLKAAALFQLFDALQVTSQGALRGLKDTRIPMFIGLLSYGGIGLGSGLFFAHTLHWREIGLWTGLILGLCTAGLTLSGRFLIRCQRLKNHPHTA